MLAAPLGNASNFSGGGLGGLEIFGSFQTDFGAAWTFHRVAS
jgi:hypothetical protein